MEFPDRWDEQPHARTLLCLPGHKMLFLTRATSLAGCGRGDASTISLGRKLWAAQSWLRGLWGCFDT